MGKAGTFERGTFLLLAAGGDLKTNLLNLRSQKAMLKIGAVQEGIFRRHIINDDGSIRDSVFFSFIKDDWPEIKTTVFGEFTS